MKNFIILALLITVIWPGESKQEKVTPVEPIVDVVVYETATRDAQWELAVHFIQKETLVRSPELAEIVAHAVIDAANEFDFNPGLLASLIRIESSGRPNVVSKVGAIGLTQVMPATGVEIASELGVDDWDLYDPATNIRFGGYYLSKLLNKFDNQEAVALAAYNYGPTHIARRIRNGHALPIEYAHKIQTRLALR